MIRIHNRFLKNRFERSVREADAGECNRQDETTNIQTATTSAASSAVSGEENPTEAVEDQMIFFNGSPPFPPPQSSQTVSELISGGNYQSDGAKKCAKASQALVDYIRHNQGARSVAEGDARRRQAPEAAFPDLPKRKTVYSIGEAIADANITNKTGGGSAPSTKGDKKGDTSSSLSWNRNIDYRFLMSTKRGFGEFDRDVKNGRGGAGEEGDADEKRQPTSPDLLQLAEDGFCLPKWSMVGDPPISTAANQSPTVNMKRTSMPTPLVLSTYLSEADTSCVSEASERQDDQAVSSPSSGGLGMPKVPSFVVRLLVVKVYTGRSLQVSSHELCDREKKVLSEAWTSGFKSVSVSPVARWEGPAEQIGGRGCQNQVRFKIQWR